jgi:hypothetical protein
MTTIRPTRRAPSESDPYAFEPAAVGRPLPPAPLRSQRLSAGSLIALGSAAAVLAALAVFALDSTAPRNREPTSAVAQATASGPAATGSFAPPSRPPAPASPSASSAATERERTAPAAAERAGSAVPAAAPASPVQMAAAPPPPAAPVVQFAPVTPQVGNRAAPVKPLVTLSADDVAAHLAHGEDKLKAGEVAAARLYFERVALSGDARGALGMARTYDAAVLASLPVIGPQPDAAAARTWRERARSLRAGP